MSPVARRKRRATARRKRAVHPLAISALVILASLFVIYYAFNQGLPFVHRFTLYAVVNNSVNVRSDSPVRIAGIDEGVVRAVSPEGNASKIAFTLDNNALPVHKDATIRIRDRLFLEGGYYLELDPGSPSAPVLGDGGSIPESQTTTPVQFYKVLSTFDVATRASLENLLGTLNEAFSPRPGRPLSDSGAGGLKRAIPQLTPVLKDVAWVTRALHGTQANDLQNLLSSASAVTGTLASNSGQLTDLLSSLNATSSALASADGALSQAVAGVDQTLRVTPGALSAIDNALGPLSKLATALDPSLRVAPPLVAGITTAVRQLAAVVSPARRGQLLSSLDVTFAQFPVLLRQLGIAFPITKSVSDCLRTHVTPLLTRTVPDGPLTTGRPVWQDFVHFLPGLTGATGNFDANGPYTRVLAGAGTNTLTGGALGSLPIVGQIVGSAPPGGGSLLGARPAWVGDLTPGVFRPDVPCSTQTVPSLSSPTAARDLASASSPAAGALSVSQLRSALTPATPPAGVSRP